MEIINKIKSFLGLIPDFAKTIIDISKWQCTADDSKLFDFDVYETSDGIFIITKASQGTVIDLRYNYYQTEIISRKIPAGAYHFGDTYYSAKESARFFANQCIHLEKNKIPGVKSGKKITKFWLDVERVGFERYSKTYNRTWIREFLAEWDSITDLKIGIYTSKNAWETYIAPMPEIHERDLWVANYGVLLPKIPKDWSDYKCTWLFWQFCANCTTCGSCGIDYGAASISIDSNKFNGIIDQFNDWLLEEEEHMPTEEYLELLAYITANSIDIESNTKRIINLEEGVQPPEKFYIDMKCLANPNLRIRETPENGTIIGSIPYLALLKGSDSVIPDSLNRGMWREIKYNDLMGWVADWYLEEV